MYSCDANENRSSAFRCNLLEYSTPLVVGDDFDPFRFFLVVGICPQSICFKEPGGHTSLSLYSIVFVDL